MDDLYIKYSAYNSLLILIFPRSKYVPCEGKGSEPVGIIHVQKPSNVLSPELHLVLLSAINIL